MLKKAYRLPAKQKFKNSSFSKNVDFTLRISKNDLSNSRFGFVVKKTLDKRAVVRNRARRVFRSCTEEMLGEIQPGYDMLFVLEKGIIKKERSEIYEELRRFFIKRELLGQFSIKHETHPNKSN